MKVEINRSSEVSKMHWIIPFIWFLVAIVFIVVEAVTLNLITIWFAGGALASLVVALIVPEMVWLQFLVFIVVSLLMFFTIRNYAVKKLRASQVKTNVNSLIGRRAVVTQKIDEFNYGEIKIDGTYWTAKSVDGQIIEKDAVVEIVEISGVKLIVKKVN